VGREYSARFFLGWIRFIEKLWLIDSDFLIASTPPMRGKSETVTMGSELQMLLHAECPEFVGLP
jgi:hypothetical protein